MSDHPHRLLSVLTSGGVLAMTVAAHATYVGSSVLLVDDTDGLVTYRVYVHFSDPADQLVAISADDVPIAFSSSAALVNDGGGFSGLIQEDTAGAPISGPRDSWLTIGHEVFAGNDTGFSAGFAGGDGASSVIHGTSFAEPFGGWFDSDLGTPVAGLDLLVAQLTFAASGFSSFELQSTVVWQAPGGGFQFSTLFVGATGTCPWDLNGDHTVGFADMLEVLSSWGPCAERDCPADFDGSGDVGLPDLLSLLAAWGPCIEK